MKHTRKILSAAALSVISQVTYAIPFAFDGRSLGMGGTSVATADLATAAWLNPAMLTNQRPSDDFSLLLGVGVSLRDDDDLVSDIDDFQAAEARRQAATTIAEEEQALNAMSAIINGIEGKVIAPEVTGIAAVGMALDAFALAISIRSDALAGADVENLSCSLSDPGCDPAELTSTNFNILNTEGVLTTEFGLSIARDFMLLNSIVSIGVKPKIVDLRRFTFSEPILTASAGFENINDDDNINDLGTFSSIDLGLAVDFSRSFRLGLNIRNLITDEFKVGNQTLNFDTEARIGLSYHNRMLTIAADYDLVENDPLLANPAYKGLKTQYLAVGAEFNAFDFAQLRIGAAKNLANDINSSAKQTALTAGVGFWLGFNLDIAATFTDNSFGGFVQTGFRF